MKLKPSQIVNPILVIAISCGIYFFFIKREKEMQKEHSLELFQKQKQIDKISDEWNIYKQQTEEKIFDLNAQINILRNNNYELEKRKQPLKEIYYEKYVEINNYNAGDIITEFDSIFTANNIK